MWNRLAVRLTLAFLIVVWLGVGVMGALVYRATEVGFQDYVRQRAGQQFSPGGQGEMGGHAGRGPGSGMGIGLAEQTFLDDVLRWLLIAGVVASLAALILGAGLAWLLARPLAALTAATERLARGALGERVEPQGTVETRALASAFNRMSGDLAAAAAQRRRLAADVAHELRTPVSVLRGHLEAMLDGIYPLDQAHVAVAYDQSLHLGRLVEDVRLLTQAEDRRLPLQRAACAPSALIAQAAARFLPLAQDAGLSLTQSVTEGLPTVYADAARMQQVLDNLLANALRHTTPGGTIMLSARRQSATVVFAVRNSGHLPPEQAAHVFDRFWRADESRQRDTGGTGLGLPIARELVRLHDGELWVETGEDETTFAFRLPDHDLRQD
jgi:signal transduction histidine kinase